MLVKYTSTMIWNRMNYNKQVMGEFIFTIFTCYMFIIRSFDVGSLVGSPVCAIVHWLIRLLVARTIAPNLVGYCVMALGVLEGVLFYLIRIASTRPNKSLCVPIKHEGCCIRNGILPVPIQIFQYNQGSLHI